MTNVPALGPLATILPQPAADRPDAASQPGFDRVLADEAHGRPADPGATDPNPGHGADATHAFGRARHAADRANTASTDPAEDTATTAPIDETADAPVDPAASADAGVTDDLTATADEEVVIAAAVAAPILAARSPSAAEPASDAPASPMSAPVVADPTGATAAPVTSGLAAAIETAPELAAHATGAPAPATATTPSPAQVADAAVAPSTPTTVTGAATPVEAARATLAQAPDAAGDVADPDRAQAPTDTALPTPIRPRLTPDGDQRTPGDRREDAPASVAAQGATPGAVHAPAFSAERPAAAAVAAATPAVDDAPIAVSGPSAADRAVAVALGRIRTTVAAGVPGLESRIDDPSLGAIRVIVVGRPGETIRAELVARDADAARELTRALDRAATAGATLPAGVDLRVRAETAGRPAASAEHRQATDGQPGRNDHADHPGSDRGFDRGASPDHQPSADRRDTAIHHPTPGRERRPGPVPATPATVIAARSGARALDVRA